MIGDYLTTQQVRDLNEEHGYFEYGDAQGDVSRAFANNAVKEFLRINEEAQSLQKIIGISPIELLEKYRDLQDEMQGVLDCLRDTQVDYFPKITECTSMASYYVNKHRIFYG